MSKINATGDVVSSNNHSRTFFTQPENGTLFAVKRRMQARSESTSSRISKQNSANNSTTNFSIASSRNNTTKNNKYVYRAPVNFYHSSVSNFGKDGIHITIGSSRKEGRYQLSTPGPGSYDPPLSGKPQDDLKYKTRFPIAQDESTNGPKNVLISGELPPSLNVNFINQPAFPEKRKISIGCSRSETNSWVRNDNYPGPSFLPKSSLSSRTHQITSRTKMPTSLMDNPGPGKYDPDPGNNLNFPRQPAYSCQGPRRRDDWIIKSIDYNVTDERTNQRIKSRSTLQKARQKLFREDPKNKKNNLINTFSPGGFDGYDTNIEFYSRTGGVDNITIPNCTGPGPTDYSPHHSVVNKKEPQWTIGKKSRKSKKRRNPNPPKSRFVGIGMFVIPLSLDADIDEDRKYIDEHPELREMMLDVMQIILENKPSEPLALMRQFFEQMKIQMEENKNVKPKSYPKLGSARRF